MASRALVTAGVTNYMQTALQVHVSTVDTQFLQTASRDNDFTAVTDFPQLGYCLAALAYWQWPPGYTDSRWTRTTCRWLAGFHEVLAAGLLADGIPGHVCLARTSS